MASTLEGIWQRVRRHWPWAAQNPDDTPAVVREVMPAEMPGVKIGGFSLVRTFAQGAFGELHLATDAGSGLPVALKTVRFAGHDQVRQRFLRETAAAARLQHPGIVATYASGIEGTGDAAMGWLAMEWVPGHDLGRYTHAARLLPEPLVLDITAKAAEALAYAHSMGVIHRDLKPSNILVNLSNGTVKLTDFGCARLSDADRSQSGVMLGSLGYMAPEQLTGAEVTGLCDVYALGVTLFELLTGRLPFEAFALSELMSQIVNQPAPRLAELRPELPPLLSDVVARALAKRAQDRQVDAAQLARELRLIAGNLGGHGSTSPSPGGDVDAQSATTP